MTTTATQRLPWQDRWHCPTVEQLLDPLGPQYRAAMATLLERLGAVERLRQDLVWYGPGWNWTIQFDQLDAEGNKLDTICYVVPDLQVPTVCLPLTVPVLERIPLRRVHKFIRTGIRAAKRAVDVHWATWQLASNTEVEQLMDLIRRRHRLADEMMGAKKAKE